MVKLFSKNSNLCDHNSPTLQTDRQTDRRTARQTTCDRNTALCTKVHRAVKISWIILDGATHGASLQDARAQPDLHVLPKSGKFELNNLRTLHWLKINERIEYKLLSLTYKVLTTSQPDYLHNLISVQSTGITRSSSLVTLARPSVSSSLQITNRSFTHASPYLWNQLPSSFRQPHSVHCPPGSPHPAHITSSQSPPSLSSPIIASRLKTHLFHKSFPI